MKHWKPAPANEDWKVAICQRDAARDTAILRDMVYVLTDAGSDQEAGENALRGMTGAQIVAGLKAHRQKCIDSVEMGPFAGQTDWEVF